MAPPAPLLRELSLLQAQSRLWPAPSGHLLHTSQSQSHPSAAALQNETLPSSQAQGLLPLWLSQVHTLSQPTQASGHSSQATPCGDAPLPASSASALSPRPSPLPPPSLPRP